MGHSLDRLVVAGRRSCHSSSGICINMAAYTHDNRVRYVVRYLYDIDNNGVLDKNDFKCLAVRNTILEAKGEFPSDRFATNCKIMDDLWNEIALLADFDKNGEVDVDEFKAAVQVNCVNKNYDQFPPMFKTFIENQFKAVDITLARYKELYAQFIGSKEEGPYMFLFGPLKE